MFYLQKTVCTRRVTVVSTELVSTLNVIVTMDGEARVAPCQMRTSVSTGAYQQQQPNNILHNLKLKIFSDRVMCLLTAPTISGAMSVLASLATKEMVTPVKVRKYFSSLRRKLF